MMPALIGVRVPTLLALMAVPPAPSPGASSASPMPTTSPTLAGAVGVSFADKVAAVSALLTFATVVLAVMTYRHTQRQARRERRAKAFAEALQAVEEYMEGPYRIRRRPRGDATVRWQITESISAIKARVSFHQAWLETEGLPHVSAAYEALVAASIEDAGPPMTGAWALPGVKRDSDVPLGHPYPRAGVDEARGRFLAACREALSAS